MNDIVNFFGANKANKKKGVDIQTIELDEQEEQTEQNKQPVELKKAASKKTLTISQKDQNQSLKKSTTKSGEKSKKQNSSQPKIDTIKEGPQPKVPLRYYTQQENKLLRRWSVKLRDVVFQNITKKDSYSIFVNITIGGFTKEKVTISASGTRVRTLELQGGEIIMGELIEDLKGGKSVNMQINYEKEIIASYDMIQEGSFTLNVWEYSRWKCNTFMGSISVPLIQVVQGHLNRSDKIKRQNSKQMFARVSYLLYFQELWDFNLTFEEWRATNLFDESGQPMAPKIKLQLQTQSLDKPTTSSSFAKTAQINHYWETLSNAMKVRATFDDIEDLTLMIYIYKSQLDPSPIRNIVSLRGVTDYGYVKMNYTNELKKEKNEEQKKQLKEQEEINKNPFDYMKKQGEQDDIQQSDVHSQQQQNNQSADDYNLSIKQNLIQGEDDNQEIELNENIVLTTIEGRVNFNNKPRYRQKGELIRFKKNQRYMVVKVIRGEQIQAEDDRGIIDSFVTLEWGGQLKRSQTFNDSSQPEFNEMFIFTVPQKGGAADLYRSSKIKQALDPRNEIIFNLWITNESLGNNNMGFARFHLSELQNAELEVMEFNDYYTRDKMQQTVRVATSTKKCQSALLSVNNSQLLFQVYFFPDVPQNFDLNTLQNGQLDRYPLEIEKQINEHEYERIKQKMGDAATLNLNQIHNSNQLFDNWNKTVIKKVEINKNKIQFNIYYRFIFVKDQYGVFHFLPKFVDKYFMTQYHTSAQELELMSQEDRDADALDKQLLSFPELAHFTRAIPNINIQISKNEIILSPDFLLLQKKGNVLDKAIMMACLFMSSHHDTQQDVIKANQKQENQLKGAASALLNVVGIQTDKRGKKTSENRVFVCLGTSKIDKQMHAWVMTINKKMDGITFWDPVDSSQYVLKDRIHSSEVEALREFLHCQKKTEKKEMFSMFGNTFNALSQGLKKGANFVGDNIALIEQKLNDKSKQNQKEAMLQAQQEKQQMEKQLKEAQQKFSQQVQEEAIYDDIIQLDDITADLKSKNIKTTGQYSDKQLLMKKQKEKDIEEEDAEFNNKSKGKPTSKFLEAYQEKVRKDEEQDDTKVRLKPEIFRDNVITPYYSIEMIFNNKNIYANVGHHSPEQIYYHLHNKEKWMPFLNVTDENNQQKAWNKNVGVFYDSRKFSEPISKRDAQARVDFIINDVQINIKIKRSGKSLDTRWKLQIDRTNKHLLRLLRLLEYRDTCRITHAEFNQRKESWIYEMKKLMPVNYHFSCCPMRFNITEPERVRSMIIENTNQFYMRNAYKILFGIQGKIFAYPNEFCWLRMVVASYWKDIQDEEEEDEDDEEGGSEDELNSQASDLQNFKNTDNVYDNNPLV